MADCPDGDRYAHPHGHHCAHGHPCPEHCSDSHPHGCAECFAESINPDIYAFAVEHRGHLRLPTLGTATITLTVIPPAKSTATYTYAGGTVTKSSTGVYTKDITLDQRGVWYLRFAGTGACQAASEATLRVRA